METASLQKPLDRLAIAASSLCAVHCLLAPGLLVLIPALASTIVGDESFHRLLLWWVVPTSSLALLLGCRRHKDWLVFVLGVLGLGQLILTVHFGHDVLGETGEKAVTMLGSVILSISHLRNHRLCRRYACEH
jgi:hypothetical protein